MRGREELRAEVLRRIASLDAKSPSSSPATTTASTSGKRVDSALNQSHAPLEVLVVNDGSTDPYTLEVLPTLESRPRARRQHDQSGPLHGAQQRRGAGARRLSRLLDADDTLDPDTLALMPLRLRARPLGAFVFPYQHFFGDQKLVWCTRSFDAYDLLWANHMTVCIMIRKAVFERSRQYRPEMKYGYEDWEFCLSLTRDGHHGALLPLPVFNHRRHGRSMTADAHDKKDFLFGRCAT